MGLRWQEQMVHGEELWRKDRKESQELTLKVFV
jgi:hypothetical protein